MKQIGELITRWRHPQHQHLHSTPHMVTGHTTTGYYVSPTSAVGQVDIDLARRGVLPRAVEWIPAELVR